jgi:hypothetical protein
MVSQRHNRPFTKSQIDRKGRSAADSANLGIAELEYELSFTKKLNDPKSLCFAQA